MRPLQLQISGLAAFKERISLDLSALSRFVICGPTGSGKTTLLDGLLYALFGQVPRTNLHGLRELISHGRERLSVVLDFSVGDQRYRVTRGRRRSGSTQAQLERLEGENVSPLADQVRAVDEQIKKLLGVGFEAFTQAVVLPQGQFMAFLKSEPRKRRQMLNELLRLQVYERMMKLAGAGRDEQGGKQADLERRLAEDYQGVSKDALAEMQARQQELLYLTEQQRQRLAELRGRLETLRRDHALCQELAAKEKDLASLRQRQQEMAERQKRIEQAHRAAIVVPLLDQADRARQERDKQASLLSQAETEQKKLLAEQKRIRIDLEQAQAAAQQVPALREKQLAMAQVIGKLPHCAELKKQCTETQRLLAEKQARLARETERQAQLNTQINTLHDQLKDVGERIKKLGYDAELDQRLESVHAQAVQLQSQRAHLLELSGKTERQKQQALIAQEQAKRLTAGSEQVTVARQQAAEQLQAAREDREAARAAHAAAHLRQGLVVGQSCPVCQQAVTTLPQATPIPQLESREQAMTQAEKAFHAASQRAEELLRQAASVQALGSGEQRQSEELQAALTEARSLVEKLEKGLAPIGAILPGTRQKESLEQRILAAREKSAKLRGQHQQLEEKARTLEQQRQAREQEAKGADQLRALAAAITEISNRLQVNQSSLAALQQEIRAVTTAADPEAERQQLAQQIELLESKLKAAEQSQARLEKLLAGARERAQQLGLQAQQTAVQASAAEQAAQQALRELGFADVAAARAAVLSAAILQQLQQEMVHHGQQLFSVQERLLELTRELAGRHVSDQELQQAEEEHAFCQKQGQEIHGQLAVLTESIRVMEDNLTKLARLQEELGTHQKNHAVYRQLAEDLQSDRFQAYLLEEVLTELVRGASWQLGKLTGERYALCFQDDQIMVADRDNAGERRSTDTLSGGETFLASLALALELSAQVQRAVGAVHLDCLFIDEGFGALDSETLRVAVDAVRGLQVGGRMVGIITHVPELREEFEQRVIVEKNGGSSTVRVEMG